MWQNGKEIVNVFNRTYNNSNYRKDVLDYQKWSSVLLIDRYKRGKYEWN